MLDLHALQCKALIHVHVSFHPCDSVIVLYMYISSKKDFSAYCFVNLYISYLLFYFQ